MALIHNRTGQQAHSDPPDSVEYGILRFRQSVFWEPSLDKGGKLRVMAGQEDYSLKDAAGNDWNQPGLTKAHPPPPGAQGAWTVGVGLLAVSFDRGAENI